PAHALLHEVARIAGGPFDQRQGTEKRRVGRALVVEGHAGQQRKRGAPDELLAPRAPLPDLRPGVWRPVEEVKADRIGDRPVVEVTGPAIHLRWRDTLGFIDEGREHAGLVPPRL